MWVYGAQSYRPFGTAAQLTVVPAEQAVELPGEVGDELGACLGIPGITAHRAVFGDGPVAGKTVLVQGVLGAVGSMAAQLARWGGATVIGTVRRAERPRSRSTLPSRTGWRWIHSRPKRSVRTRPDGVHRIVEVAFSDNADLDAAVAAADGVIAAYGTAGPARTSRSGRCCSPTSRSDCSAATTSRARRYARPRPTSRRAAREGALTAPIGDRLPLADIAEAHERVEAGSRRRVLVSLPD